MSYPVAAVRNRNVGGMASYITQWLLRDEFTTDEAAPIASPRTAEPGPGTLVRSGATGFFGIANGKLNSTGSADWNSAMYYDYGSVPPSGVVALFIYARPGTDASAGQIGWRDTNYYPNMWFTSGQIAPFYLMSSAYTTILVSTSATICAVISGARVVIVRLVGTDWVVQYVDNQMGRYFVFAPNTASAWLDRLRIATLAAPWSVDYGIATNWVASPVSGETTTMEADALVEFSWTPTAGETLDLMVRRDSDTDCWSVVCAEATAANANTSKLVERNGGNTERSSAAVTFTAGAVYRIVVVMYGTTIKIWLNHTITNSYASASHNQTATGVKVFGFTTGSNLVAWPRTLSGAAKAALDEVAA